jgi:hypothetical protein
VPDHGAAVVNKEGQPVVLEHHESGPEIVVGLALCTAVAALAKSVIDLVTVIVKARSAERRTPSVKITVTRRSLDQSGGALETEVQLELPISGRENVRLRKAIEKAIEGIRR